MQRHSQYYSNLVTLPPPKGLSLYTMGNFTLNSDPPLLSYCKVSSPSPHFPDTKFMYRVSQKKTRPPETSKFYK